MKQGLLTVAVVVTFASSAVTHAQISNGSFETGDFTDWVTQDAVTPFFPLGVAPGGTVDTFGWGWFNTPTDGNFDAVHGFDGDGATGGVNMIRIAQDAFINGPTLTFDYRAAWDLTFGGTIDRTFSVNVEPTGGGPSMQTDLILTATQGSQNFDTGPMNGAVDVAAFVGQNVRVSFDWFIAEDFVGPGQFTLDNVQLIPAPGALGLVMLAGLAGRRRRRM